MVKLVNTKKRKLLAIQATRRNYFVFDLHFLVL